MMMMLLLLMGQERLADGWQLILRYMWLLLLLLLLLHLTLYKDLSLGKTGLSLAQRKGIVHGLLLPLEVAGILSLFFWFDARTILVQWKGCLGQLIVRLHLLRKFGRIKLHVILLQKLVLQAQLPRQITGTNILHTGVGY